MASKEPKPRTNKERKEQATKLILKELQKARPDLSEGGIQVLWAQAARGDGDWKALVLVHGTDDTIYSVGYNRDSDTLFFDTFGRVSDG